MSLFGEEEADGEASRETKGREKAPVTFDMFEAKMT